MQGTKYYLEYQWDKVYDMSWSDLYRYVLDCTVIMGVSPPKCTRLWKTDSWLPNFRLVDVAPKVTLRNPIHANYKAWKPEIHPGFETQGICYQKSKTGTSGSYNIFFKKEVYNM